MGHRTIMRVPLDFDHPQGEVWPGYLSPDPRPCPAGDDCYNGYTVDGVWLKSVVTCLALLSASDHDSTRPNGVFPHPWLEGLPLAPQTTKPVGRRWDGTPYRQGAAPGEGYVSCVPKVAPATKAFNDLVIGLLASVDESRAEYRRKDMFLGHDAVDSWQIAKAIVTAAGLDPNDWGICPTCEGHCCHPDDIDMNDDWTSTEPPEGPGWQLWETTSEGSPVSPVFESPEALAEWCEDNASWFAGEKTTRESWLRMFVNDTTDVDTMLIYSRPSESAS